MWKCWPWNSISYILVDTRNSQVVPGQYSEDVPNHTRCHLLAPSISSLPMLQNVACCVAHTVIWFSLCLLCWGFTAVMNVSLTMMCTIQGNLYSTASALYSTFDRWSLYMYVLTNIFDVHPQLLQTLCLYFLIIVTEVNFSISYSGTVRCCNKTCSKQTGPTNGMSSSCLISKANSWEPGYPTLQYVHPYNHWLHETCSSIISCYTHQIHNCCNTLSA